MRQQGDRSTPRQIPLSCKSTIANNQHVRARKNRAERKEGLGDGCKPTFYFTIRTTVLQSSSEEIAVFPVFFPTLFSFCHPRCLCRLLAEDGDDGTGWIFNRFVSGSTIGGRIVVNIITYRSLPCQTGAITHSSPPSPAYPPSPTLHTNTHTSLSHFSVTVPVYTAGRCRCLVRLLTLRPASLRFSCERWYVPFRRFRLLCSCCPEAPKCGDRSQGPAYQWLAECLKSSTNCWENGSLNRSCAAHDTSKSPFRTIITIMHRDFMAKTAAIR